MLLWLHEDNGVLPDSIFRRAKAKTALQGRTLRSFILTAVVHELASTDTARPARSKLKLPLVRSRRPESLRITGDTLAKALLGDERVYFAQEPADLEPNWRRHTQKRTQSHRVWSDAYLVAFAEAAGLTNVSFDRGFRQYGVKPVILRG